jgi:hypothetical protein
MISDITSPGPPLASLVLTTGDHQRRVAAGGAGAPAETEARTQPGRSPQALGQQAEGGFEETFEPLGLTALAIQVVTGLWMAWIYLPGLHGLFNPANPIGMLVGVKLLLLLAATAALAIAFVVVGALIRLGGLG